MALMHNDKRSKGCPNEGCARNAKKHLYKADEHYCVECGSKLVYVCRGRDCFRPLVSDDPSVTLCAHCQAKRDDRLQRARNTAAAVAGGAAGVAAGAKLVVGHYGPAIVKGAKLVAGRVIRF